jgi:hypothetical protein
MRQCCNGCWIVVCRVVRLRRVAMRSRSSPKHRWSRFVFCSVVKSLAPHNTKFGFFCWIAVYGIVVVFDEIALFRADASTGGAFAARPRRAAHSGRAPAARRLCLRPHRALWRCNTVIVVIIVMIIVIHFC